MSTPDREIIAAIKAGGPTPDSEARTRVIEELSQTPLEIRQTVSSIAGASSQEFGKYQQARRREYTRLAALDAEYDEEIKKKKFQEVEKLAELEESSRAANKRKKRLLKKQKALENRKKAKVEKRTGFSNDGSFLESAMKSLTNDNVTIDGKNVN